MTYNDEHLTALNCDHHRTRTITRGIVKCVDCGLNLPPREEKTKAQLVLTCPVHGEYEVTSKQKTCPTCLTQAALYRQIEEEKADGVEPEEGYSMAKCPVHGMYSVLKTPNEPQVCPKCESKKGSGPSNEFDPTGAEAHEPGAKLDGGKTLAGVLSDFSLALQAVAEVGTHGARKYSRGGWQSVPDALTRYKDAEWRHLLKSRHEEYDPDSGLLHDAHKAWNVLAQLELRLRGDAIDWKTYPASVTVDLDKLEAHNKAVVEEAREIQRRNK